MLPLERILLFSQYLLVFSPRPIFSAHVFFLSNRDHFLLGQSVYLELLYDMGLNTYLTQEGVVNYEPQIYEYKAVVLEVHRVTEDDQIPILQMAN